MQNSPTLPASPTHPCYECGAIGAHCHLRRPIDANRIVRYIDWLIKDTTAADQTSWNHGAAYALKLVRDKIEQEIRFESLARMILDTDDDNNDSDV